MSSPVTRFKDEIADAYVLGPVRVVIGALLGWHALEAAKELGTIGYFGDVFHVSMLPDVLVPSARLYAVLLALRVCLAVMVMFGVWARPGLALSAALGVWMLLCDRLQFHHNRYSLDCYALLLSLTPCDRSWRATESAVPEPRTGPFWAVRLCQLQVSIIYLASGGAKLLDPDWRSGVVPRVSRNGSAQHSDRLPIQKEISRTSRWRRAYHAAWSTRSRARIHRARSRSSRSCRSS